MGDAHCTEMANTTVPTRGEGIATRLNHANNTSDTMHFKNKLLFEILNKYIHFEQICPKSKHHKHGSEISNVFLLGFVIGVCQSHFLGAQAVTVSLRDFFGWCKCHLAQLLFQAFDLTKGPTAMSKFRCN